MYELQLKTPRGAFYYFTETKTQMDIVLRYFDNGKSLSNDLILKCCQDFSLPQNTVENIIRKFGNWYISIKDKKGDKIKKNLEDFIR